MKGIILAGGSGTRLDPITRVISKQLLPVYDKPVIYYPLATLMMADIREILIISTPRDVPLIQQLLGDGNDLGLTLTYAIQDEPKGIAEAFIIGADFIGKDNVCLILGDNLFVGHDFPQYLKAATPRVANSGASIFAYRVQDPERYGIVELDKENRPLSIVEKPKNPKSPWAVTGLYVYDATVIDKARTLGASDRGELEITDLNRAYLEQKKLRVTRLGRGIAWLDVGTHDSLCDSSTFIQTLEQRQGLKIACVEEIAFSQNFIDLSQLEKLSEAHGSSSYGAYLKRIVRESHSS